MRNPCWRATSVILAILMTLGSFSSAGASLAARTNGLPSGMTIGNATGNAVPVRPTKYYMVDRVMHNPDFAQLAAWGINTAVVDFDVNGAASEWRAAFTSAAAAHIDIVIWPSDWNDPRPNCGWESPYPVSATGDITKVKNLMDVATQYTNFIGIVNSHENFWTCDITFDEMAGLKDKLKAYALSKGRAIKVWNYVDHLYWPSMLPDNQIERIMDVAVTWQHCAGNAEGPCDTASGDSALTLMRSDRNRITSSGAHVELVYLMQTFTMSGKYSTKFTLDQLETYGCEFLNSSTLDGFSFYTWNAGWWPDLHSWPELHPAIPYLYNTCVNHGAALPTISGNAGLPGVTMTYHDGTDQTAVSNANGDYSLTVSSGWTGTVTPSLACYAFNPPNRSYTNLATNQANQDFQPTAISGAGCAAIHVSIANAGLGTYGIPQGSSSRQAYAGESAGPVNVSSAGGQSILSSMRVIYGTESFSEMMALPNNQLDTTYWLPWYNDVDLDTQLRFGNVSGSAASVHVSIGGTEMPGSPFALGIGASTRVSFAGVNNGPVQITSDQDIVAAERVLYNVNGANTSFSEMMALPNSSLDISYWLPWYNDVDLDTQLRIGNVSSLPASVHIYIHGAEMPGSPFSLDTGESTRVSFAGTNNGPVKITSDQQIVAAERVLYKVNTISTSFTETMALPNSKLDTTYWLPWYNDVDLDTQLRFGNVSAFPASVHVTIGGVEMPGSPFSLGAGGSTRVSFRGVSNGLVRVTSDRPIVAAERIIYKVSGLNTSFSEMMALPNSSLDTSYWLPWYNNVDLDTQLRFGMP